MARLLATIKAIITRIIFSTHAFIAIWQVTQYKQDPLYWCICAPIGVLFVEGVFTLAIKKNQEWRWFCPSVFIYLSSIVPAIWLLELDKLEKRTLFQDQVLNETINFAATVGKDLKDLNKMLGVKIQLPEIQLNADTWVTLIEQFLMLVLIIGRWMLPKGDLTRDQLSQLLLVYIGTAADIIEFFDSFKDNKIANEPVLVQLTLSIWSWSLLQFTIVLSATRARKPRGGGSAVQREEENHCCNMTFCNIDVWGIALNILLQDAPFLTFRLLIIIHYKIITYMNIFFTCKNTLVILLQLYRLYVVHSENRKTARHQRRGGNRHSKQQQKRTNRRKVADFSDDEIHEMRMLKHHRKLARARKDTGYSTASSQTTIEQQKKRTHGGLKASSAARRCQAEDEDALQIGTKRSGKKGGKSRKLMATKDNEFDVDEMEQVRSDRKRKRCKDNAAGRVGGSKYRNQSNRRSIRSKARKHQKTTKRDMDHDDVVSNDDATDAGELDVGREQELSDANDTASGYEIVNEKSTSRKKKAHSGSAAGRVVSSAGSSSGSSE
ncbi:transmembrane protein 26 [Toxorhynchites rutilus septentrionalis]|uniref:transmembrane protein 26 n=1 Tax=Toxorhynchites rutilus septentrionalis TaxID=329112 RepID=UPI002479322D|nr:transmembrane protein 26 [Toxorhynchites rutilus septentrionalis]